jgi:hypothetical protein
MPSSGLTDLQREERSHWLYRAVEVTRGNQTRMGCLLLAVMNQNAKNPPWMWPKGMIITADGECITGLIMRDRSSGQDSEMVVSLGTVTELVDAWRKLADKIKATDTERVQMFEELRKHVLRDNRPIGSQVERTPWI